MPVFLLLGSKCKWCSPSDVASMHILVNASAEALSKQADMTVSMSAKACAKLRTH